VEALGEDDLKSARIIDAFPPLPEEKMLSGYHPGNPFGEKTGMEVVGDFRKAPWRNGDASFTGAQRTELAQTFTIKRPCTVHRVEAYLKDSEGAFAIRKPVQVRIVKLGEDGLPTNNEILSTDAFAPTWADSRSWRYARARRRRCREAPRRIPGHARNPHARRRRRHVEARP